MFLTTSIHFLFLIFLALLSLVVVLIILVLLYGFFQYKQSVRASGWLKIINQKISEVIVYDEDELPSDQSFRKFSENPSFRNLFLHQLVGSEKKFSGTAKNRIRDMFRQYDLHREAVKKLDQKKPHLIAGGIQELTVMDSKESLSKIASLVAHPSEQVYQEAQYAMVSLKGFEGLGFLNTTRGIISEWQQLRLLLSITSVPDNSGEAIEAWLTSTNDSVIIFTLKLLRKFQLLSFYPSVISLMEHPSVEVRVQAVQTLLSLENSSTIASLIEMYPHQPVEVQLEILRTMKISKDKDCTGLLKKELSESTVSGIKVYAAETLFVLGNRDYLEQLMHDETSSEELIHIIKYALREKIC